MEGQDKENEQFWETARVVSGRLIGINKNANEITVEIESEDDELFKEDYDLPEDFDKEQFEELLEYLDLNVRVVLLDSTVMKIVCDGQLG